MSRAALDRFEREQAKPADRWHYVSEADARRIGCQAAQGTCPEPAWACHHAQWNTGNTKGVSFFYYCLSHAVDRGFRRPA